MDIGNLKSNIDRLSTETLSDLDRHRREVIEAKLYYLRHTNSPEEFDYVVDAEMRRGEAWEFGLPAKELVRRMKVRVKNVFKRREKEEATIYEQLMLSKYSAGEEKSTCAPRFFCKRQLEQSAWTPRKVLRKTHGMPVCKQTWETSPQDVASAMLASS